MNQAIIKRSVFFVMSIFACRYVALMSLHDDVHTANKNDIKSSNVTNTVCFYVASSTRLNKEKHSP